MKVLADRRLFWFLKDKTELDLNNPTHLNIFVQQVLTYGKFEDVKKLLSLIDENTFKKSFNNVRNFLPREIRRFWERGSEEI